MPQFKGPFKADGSARKPIDLPVGSAFEGIYIGYNVTGENDSRIYRIFSSDERALVEFWGTFDINSCFNKGFKDGSIRPGDYIRLEREEDVITKQGRTMLKFELRTAVHDEDTIALFHQANDALQENGEETLSEAVFEDEELAF